jgi:hypothetical protein
LCLEEELSDIDELMKELMTERTIEQITRDPLQQRKTHYN